MSQQVTLQNEAMMGRLRTNLAEAKRDLCAFITLWKYLQIKQQIQKLQRKIDGKIN